MWMHRRFAIQWRQTSENPASVGSHLNWAGPHCILGHAGPWRRFDGHIWRSHLNRAGPLAANVTELAGRHNPWRMQPFKFRRRKYSLQEEELEHHSGDMLPPAFLRCTAWTLCSQTFGPLSASEFPREFQRRFFMFLCANYIWSVAESLAKIGRKRHKPGEERQTQP